ncbi:hypothetical protein [Actinomadura atramentaria]|uniref:hypothetical protein n=1 Tax=Actinomadura atramentaria TaxID=1990 RepID=UPI00036D714D|nr:hypothetical protein [Actinomadura atramentaria]
MTDAHVCTPYCFYWPRTYCPLSGGSEGGTPEETPGDAASDGPTDLTFAFDLVSAAYHEAMRRAGMLTGKVYEVTAYARSTLREALATVERRTPYRVVLADETVHVRGVAAEAEACPVDDGGEPLSFHDDLSAAVMSALRAAGRRGVGLCPDCSRAANRAHVERGS